MGGTTIAHRPDRRDWCAFFMENRIKVPTSGTSEARFLQREGVAVSENSRGERVLRIVTVSAWRESGTLGSEVTVTHQGRSVDPSQIEKIYVDGNNGELLRRLPFEGTP